MACRRVELEIELDKNTEDFVCAVDMQNRWSAILDEQFMRLICPWSLKSGSLLKPGKHENQMNGATWAVRAESDTFAHGTKTRLFNHVLSIQSHCYC